MKRWLLIVALAGLGALGLLALAGWRLLYRELPQELADGSPAERFKYGSIGAENDQGLPYWIWLVLPRMFPEYLPGPGGWASLGFAWEAGRPLPVGFSRKTIGFERVAINCAFCHSARVRAPGEAVARVYPAGPGNTLDPLAYQRFLLACGSDPRFTADNVLREIAQVHDLSWVDRLLYRFLLVPGTRRALRQQKLDFAWTDHRPDWGRGRIDPFNPIKFGILKQRAYGDRPIHEIDDQTIGNADMQPIWNLRPRVERKMAFHWDGLNTDLDEVILSSAIGDGARPQGVAEKLRGLRDYLLDLPAPRFTALFPVDQQLAARGAPIFQRQCAGCHALDGAHTGQVLPLTDQAWGEGSIAGATRPFYTDPHRARMWTPVAAQAYNGYAQKQGQRFRHFRSTGGYVNVPLDGLWIRAPYLHNGSVPYLGDLLERPERRPRIFHRGLDHYDPQRMGFVAEGPEAGRLGTPFDTRQPGNSNQGHLWGTDLDAPSKTALLEYLKTL